MDLREYARQLRGAISAPTGEMGPQPRQEAPTEFRWSQLFPQGDLVSDEWKQRANERVQKGRGFVENLSIPKPFIGTAQRLNKDLRIRSIGAKMDLGKATKEEVEEFYDHFVESNLRSDTFWGKVSKLGSGSLEFAGEIAAGGGVGGLLAKGAAKATASKLIAKGASEASAAFVSKAMTRAASMGVTVAAQEGVPRVLPNALGGSVGGAWTANMIDVALGDGEYTDEQKQAMADDMNSVVQVAYEKGGDLLQGMALSLVDVASESAGGPIGKALPPVAYLDGLFGAALRKVAGRVPAGQMSKVLADAMQWSGPFRETMEELVAEVGKAALITGKTVPEAIEEWTGNLPVMLTTFAIPGVGGAAARRTSDAVRLASGGRVAGKADVGDGSGPAGPVEPQPSTGPSTPPLSPQSRARAIENFKTASKEDLGEDADVEDVGEEIGPRTVSQALATKVFESSGVASIPVRMKKGSKARGYFDPETGAAVWDADSPIAVRTAYHEVAHAKWSSWSEQRRKEFVSAVESVDPEFMKIARESWLADAGFEEKDIEGQDGFVTDEAQATGAESLAPVIEFLGTDRGQVLAAKAEDAKPGQLRRLYEFGADFMRAFAGYAPKAPTTALKALQRELGKGADTSTIKLGKLYKAALKESHAAAASPATMADVAGMDVFTDIATSPLGKSMGIAPAEEQKPEDKGKPKPKRTNKRERKRQAKAEAEKKAAEPKAEPKAEKAEVDEETAFYEAAAKEYAQAEIDEKYAVEPLMRKLGLFARSSEGADTDKFIRDSVVYEEQTMDGGTRWHWGSGRSSSFKNNPKGFATEREAGADMREAARKKRLGLFARHSTSAEIKGAQERYDGKLMTRKGRESIASELEGFLKKLYFGKRPPAEWKTYLEALRGEGTNPLLSEQVQDARMRMHKSAPKHRFARLGAGGTRSLAEQQTAKGAGRTSDVKHKRTSDGRYVGAPDWVGSSPNQLAVLRNKLRRLAKEGEPGRFWYEDSSRAILELTGGDRVEAEKIVGLIAIYSPNATVPANTTMALTAYYQFLAGVPIKAGLGASNKKAEDLLRHGKAWGGIKTNSFYQNLMVEIDPSALDSGVATMDMWIALAFDYGDKVLDQGPKYHFTEREIRRLAEELGWTAHQVQAAVWTAIKGRIDPIRPLLKQQELKLGIGEETLDPETGKTTYAYKKERTKDHFRLAHKLGMEYALDPADIEASKYNFSHAFEGRAVQVSWEATPGKTSGVLPGLLTAPIDQKFEYLAAVRGALTDNGRDLMADLIGLPSGQTKAGFSAWEGAIGAGAQTRIAVPTEGAGDKKSIRGPARDLLNLYAAVKGYVLAQEAVVYHLPIWDGSVKNQNGIEVRFPRVLTEAEVGTIYTALQAEFGTSELAPAHRENGVRILNFVDGLANTRFHVGVRKILAGLPNDFGGGTFEFAGFKSDGGYISNDWKEKPNGEGYYDQIAAQRPDVLGGLDDLRSRVEAVNREFTERYGWGAASVGDAQRGPDGPGGGGRFARRRGGRNKLPQLTFSAALGLDSIAEAAAWSAGTSGGIRTPHASRSAAAAVERDPNLGLSPEELSAIDEARRIATGDTTQVGRPGLNNPGATKQSRALIRGVDEERRALMDVRPLELVHEEAEANLAEGGVERRRELERMLAAGSQLTDTETVEAVLVLEELVSKWVKSQKTADFAGASLWAQALRATRTSQARALGATRNMGMSAEATFAEALVAPTRSQERRLRRLRRRMAAVIRRTVGTSGDKPGTNSQVLQLGALFARAPKLDAAKRKASIQGFDRDSGRMVSPAAYAGLEAQVQKIEAEVLASAQRGLQAVQAAGYTTAQMQALWLDPVAGRPMRATFGAAKAGWSEKAFEYRYMSILSGLRTHVKNVSGNTVNFAVEGFLQPLVEGMINVAARREDAAAPLEAFTFARGAAGAFKAAVSNAWLAWRGDIPVLEVQMHKAGVNIGAYTSRADAIEADRLAPATDNALANTLRKMSLSLLLAMDEFFKTLAVHGQSLALATRIAKNEGLSGAARESRIQALLSDASHPLWAEAIDKARKITFQDEGGSVSQAVERAGYSMRTALDTATPYFFLGTTLLPFIGTPVRIVANVLRRSPLEVALFAGRILRMKYRDKPQEFVKDAADAAIAMVITATVWALMDDDEDGLPNVTGSRPANRGEAELMQRLGIPPMSVRIGGRWFQYRDVEPLSTSLGIMADGIAEFKRTGSLGALQATMSSAMNQVKDKTFVRTLGELYDLTQDSTNAQGRVADMLSFSFITPWVPNAIRQPLRAFDDSVRARVRQQEGENIFVTTAKDLPYQMLPVKELAPAPRFDLWGRPILKESTQSPSAPLVRLLAPMLPQGIKGEQLQADVFMKAYNDAARDGQFGEERPSYPLLPSYTFEYGGVVHRWTDDEYAELTQRAGESAATAVASLVKSGVLSVDNPRPEQMDLVRKMISNARKPIAAELKSRRLKQGTEMLPVP